MTLAKEHCPKCNSLIINGKHYTVGKNTPAWTDKEIKLAEKFDKLHKEGKVTFRSIEID